MSINNQVCPINTFVLIAPKRQEQQTASGIVLAETKKQDRPNEGAVLAVSEEVKKVKVGDWVHFQKLGPIPVDVEGEECFYVFEKDILGVVMRKKK